jgi:hypothetical protein
MAGDFSSRIANKRRVFSRLARRPEEQRKRHVDWKRISQQTRASSTVPNFNNM